jgi:1-acyl-sn-glycerol-3-phosphate acyltransferase
MHQGFAGAALIAYRTGAPIVPIAITGTETIPWPTVFLRPFMGPRVTIMFGKPFYPPKAERITSAQAKVATDDMMVHVAEMLPEQYRGYYATAAAEREAARSPEAAAEPV